MKGDSIALHSLAFPCAPGGKDVAFEDSRSGVVQHYVVQHYNDLEMIPQELLDLLVCPVCQKPLILGAHGESLKCGECRRVYPIQDDIPIMLVGAATIDAA
jgi:uncharacterized protein YbaR (Trm112 family)